MGMEHDEFPMKLYVDSVRPSALCVDWSKQYGRSYASNVSGGACPVPQQLKFSPEAMRLHWVSVQTASRSAPGLDQPPQRGKEQQRRAEPQTCRLTPQAENLLFGAQLRTSLTGTLIRRFVRDSAVQWLALQTQRRTGRMTQHALLHTAALRGHNSSNSWHSLPPRSHELRKGQE